MYKKPNFWMDVIIFSIIVFAGFFLWSRYNPTSQQAKNEAKIENSIAAERYEILTERFKIPQKVIGVDESGDLMFEENVWVTLRFNNASINDFNARKIFVDYAENNLVGVEVLVIMPEKNFFIVNYCCRNQHLDDSQIPQSVKDSEHFHGFVYSNNEFINEKFGFYKSN